MSKKEQNEISYKVLEGSDLAEREQEVLKDAIERTGFVPTKLIGRSAWWGSSEIGAFHYIGEFEGRKAALKVQGVKPSISEIYMIESFAKTNRSTLLRSPYLYSTLPWDDQRRYEALIMEFIEGDTIVHIPMNQAEVDRFYQLYQNYKTNCLQFPWVDKPEETISYKVANNFAKWREASFKIYPNHPLRNKNDKELIDRAVEILTKEYKGVEPGFQHGHLANSDLYQVGDQVVVLSNLYWSWRPPFYDAIFSYHWFMYHLNNVDGITPKEVEQQRSLLA